MTASATPTTIVLIDGHALAFRSYFSMQGKTFSNAGGENTHAVHIFMKTLVRFLKVPTNQVIVLFDPPVKTFRHEQFDGYKAGRADIPADLPGQINRIRELVDAMGIPRLEVPGYEADDVVGTLSVMAAGQGHPVRILTSDRDSYQLLHGDIRVISSDFALIGPDEVREKYGVSVEQWVDYRSLTGDSSDNIPGAKGIGPKTAAKLLQDYGTLDTILEKAQDGTLEPKSAREKIVASLDNVKFSRQLSCIVTDLPLSVELGVGRMPGDPARLDALLTELELGSLRRDLLALEGGAAKGTAIGTGPGADAPASFLTPPQAEWRTPGEGEVWGYVLSREDDLTAELLDAATFDGEVVRVAPVTLPQAKEAAPEGLGLGTPGTGKAPKTPRAPKAPVGHVEEAEFIGQREVKAAGAKALATHLNVRGLGQIVPGDDPLLMAYLLDPATTSMTLASEKFLNVAWPDDAATRAAITAELLHRLPAELDDARKRLYNDIERPLAKVLARMEVRGIRLDSEYLRGLGLATGARIQALEQEIYAHAGHEFSVSSRDQLEKVLYDELGLASGKKTKLTGKRSTAVSALEPLRNEHPIIPVLLEYRELSKLKGTYLDPLPALVNPRTGRLHTTFAQASVATGRLSSLNPNLQNIPIRSAVGRELRKGFIADPGFQLISADYSQIELRLLAHIADDELMQQAFVSGADIHRRTASQVLGVMEDLVTVEQRRAAKTVNFGVLYGMSAHRLSNDLGIPYADASGFIDRYFATYPGIRGYIDRTLAFGREHGYVETLFGRRRYVPELSSSNRNVREAGERVAYNMPIQGTAADIIKLAMVRLDQPLEELGARMLLQVHDELLVEAPEDRAEEVAALVQTMMQDAMTLKVPLNVEVGVGPNWFDTK
ncbi:DNA polymerase I [Deinococcus ruber]|uniref:DNA polymerase I n=1 Tax=Deinococcus ruber TaxID=1848197 RepID=A0A918C705_9DEIO|nr:DNA polymerase I [Deinococcus ruber]GGR08923.1 DNA polymerase I [Deinococcus ruber]